MPCSDCPDPQHCYACDAGPCIRCGVWSPDTLCERCKRLARMRRNMRAWVAVNRSLRKEAA